MANGLAIATAAFSTVLVIALLISQPALTAGAPSTNSTVVRKNEILPFKHNISMEPCAISYCVDV